jgi:ribonucleoside-diphosphate reductase alpha chain
VNLWLKAPDLKVLSHMYRSAWHAGLKTTYYLRSMGASGIEKATLAGKKDVRGAAGETKAETATRDTRVAAASAVLSGVERTEVTTAPFLVSLDSNPPVLAPSSELSAPSSSAKKVYTADEKRVCSIEAMKNGEECEACQ